jgi:uncharacterized protein
MTPLSSSLYDVSIYHKRYVHTSNAFRYRMFLFALDLDELVELPRRLRLFGLNRFNLFSFRNRDHFKWRPDAESAVPRELVERQLAEMGAAFRPQRIVLVTGVRMLGYVFNPVSFYYCYDRDDRLRYVLAEVNNTYLEQKPFLVELEGGADSARVRTQKNFYVSPFIRYDADFSFVFKQPAERLYVRIDSLANEQLILKAVLTGERRPLNDASLLAAFARFPFATLRVIYLIHRQALRLWLKKTPYFAKAWSDEKIRETDAKQDRAGLAAGVARQ